AHQVLSGLAMGAIYASLALALVMIYRATDHVNFAQGEMAMFSTYIAWAIVQAGWPFWLPFVAALFLSFVGGPLLRRIIIRPVETAPVLNVIIVFIGLLVIVNSLAGWLFSYSLQVFPSPFPSDAWYGSQQLSPQEVGMMAVTLLVLAFVFLFFRFTPLG